MAKFNPTDSGALLFGKQNGQNISITRNGSIIRNTSQPPKSPTIKQSLQRFQTSILANQYLSLSAISRNKWSIEKVNYTYVNSAGLTVERTTIGTFNFINQNLHLINKPMLLEPETYSPITPADITIISSNANELKIIDTNSVLGYSYVVFVEVHNSLGQISFTPEPLVTQILSQVELKSGVDLMPNIISTFNLLPFEYNITFRIIAVDETNGNRDLYPVTYNTTVNVPGPIIFDPDYQSVLDYASLQGFTLPTASQQIKQNQLMLDIKTVLPLSAFDLFYVMLHDGGDQFGWVNWANSQNFSQNGTWNFIPNLGYQVRNSGSDVFTSNFHLVNDSVAYTKNNASYGFYTGAIGGGWASGDWIFEGNNAGGRLVQVDGSSLRFGINDNSFPAISTASTINRFSTSDNYSIINRLNASTKQLHMPYVSINNQNVSSTAIPNENLIFGRVSGSFTTSIQFMHLGRALTQTEGEGLKNAFLTYINSI